MIERLARFQKIAIELFGMMCFSSDRRKGRLVIAVRFVTRVRDGRPSLKRSVLTSQTLHHGGG